jgi:hypothetical protein
VLLLLLLCAAAAAVCCCCCSDVADAAVLLCHIDTPQDFMASRSHAFEVRGLRKP